MDVITRWPPKMFIIPAVWILRAINISQPDPGKFSTIDNMQEYLWFKFLIKILFCFGKKHLGLGMVVNCSVPVETRSKLQYCQNHNSTTTKVGFDTIIGLHHHHLPPPTTTYHLPPTTPTYHHHHHLTPTRNSNSSLGEIHANFKVT